MFTPLLLSIRTVFCFFLVAFLGGSAAFETSPTRSNRIRFPTNESPPQNYFGPQMFPAESQDLPIIRGISNFKGSPYSIAPQVSSLSKPFVEENLKGYSEAIIYQQHGGHDEDFYHLASPPIRSTPYGSLKLHLANGNKPLNTVIKQKRQPERHRFSPQRYNHNQVNPGKPFPGPVAQLYNPNILKEAKPENVYKQVLLAHHGLQKHHGNGHFDNDYMEAFKNHQLKKFRPQQQQPAPQFSHSSEELYDYEQPRPHWQMKEQLQEQLKSEPTYFKKPQNSHPHHHYPQNGEIKQYLYKQNPEENYSFEDSSEFQETVNKFPHKKYIPISDDNQEYLSSHEVTKHVPEYESNHKYSFPEVQVHRRPAEYTSHSVQAHHKKVKEEPYLEITKEKITKYTPHNFERVHRNPSFEHKSTSGSEWIPINAPEGALPAKSYDIPAPDLSKGHDHVQFHRINSQNFHDNERVHHRPGTVENFKINQRPSNIVYGGRKKIGNEEVVSASVMVKQ